MAEGGGVRVHFWGVRGSVPTPVTPRQVQSKIAAVVQRISAKDVRNQRSKERFISDLPAWLFGTTGGNTTCVEMETDCGETLIFDAGTGIRDLGIDLMSRPGYRAQGHVYHLLFTHFHWDHIQGLPFFNPAFDPRNTIIVYSTRKKMKEFLEDQMRYPYFPISMFGRDGFNAKFEFRLIGNHEECFTIGKTKITWNRVRHPGGCVSYAVSEAGGKKVIFSTDTELRQKDFDRSERNVCFYDAASLLIIDSQYTMTESIKKEGWGHSTFSIVVDFAVSWGVRRLALFHHEPTYDDKKLFSILQNACWYRKYVGAHDLEILLAQEGKDIFV